MPLKEPYATKAKRIGRRLIELESSNPGLVRMRATYNASVVAAMVEKLKTLGFSKGFFESSKQFLYDSFLTHQAAVEACLPYTLFDGPPTKRGHSNCWAGVGLYVGWHGVLAIEEFFDRRCGDLDGVALMVDIKPFYAEIREFLDPFPPERDGSSFDRALELQGAVRGLAAFVERDYLNEHYPGYVLHTQAVRHQAGKSFDVVEVTTADGTRKTLYFALVDYDVPLSAPTRKYAVSGCIAARSEELLDGAVHHIERNDIDGFNAMKGVWEIPQGAYIDIRERKAGGKIFVTIEGIDGDFWTLLSYTEDQ